jgi:DNA-binding transcriptional ArsR family regulator
MRPVGTNDALSATFEALADPTRRAILGRLTDGDAAVNELAALFPSISLQAVSKHLTRLPPARRPRGLHRRVMRFSSPRAENPGRSSSVRRAGEDHHERRSRVGSCPARTPTLTADTHEEAPRAARPRGGRPPSLEEMKLGPARLLIACATQCQPFVASPATGEPPLPFICPLARTLARGLDRSSPRHGRRAVTGSRPRSPPPLHPRTAVVAGRQYPSA